MLIKATGVNAALTHSVYVVNDHYWTETGITWNNKPPSSKLITSFTPTANIPVELDVSQQVRDALLTGKQLLIHIVVQQTQDRTNLLTMRHQKIQMPLFVRS